MAIYNLTDQLIHDLGKQIITGDIIPGETLPKIETLSEIHGVSRTVVREAFKALATRRLVKSVPRLGTIVSPRSEWQWWDTDVLSWASDSGNNRNFILKLNELGFAIEPIAAKLAAKNATQADIVKITDCYDQLEKSLGDKDAWAQTDYEFHKSIYDASNNELLVNMLQMLSKVQLDYRFATITSIKEQQYATERYLQFHKELLIAISNHDEKSAQQKMYDLQEELASILANSNP
ncbi:FadR/GntR family transcriptional regulator [Neobacillus vireti]|uniref:GntR family transcriptional regulator n=1 Tax=Neobacillus vireti LMG 21834 TaxID=1131730 RepID=A0AB94IK50_9BACI|nr:FadR/GntR family transcriptional regulator [Neobacillus vireti]ETI67414.1 GntR family transcriptional regulator [Neobacillus vireti LMG 21834]